MLLPPLACINILLCPTDMTHSVTGVQHGWGGGLYSCTNGRRDCAAVQSGGIERVHAEHNGVHVYKECQAS